MAQTARNLIQRRRMRVRNKLKRVAGGRPRLSVHRSSKNMSVQVIDDAEGRTIASASTLEAGSGMRGKNTVETAGKIGQLIAERAKAAGVEEVFFDRGAYLYHGRVKALADAAREGGLKF